VRHPVDAGLDDWLTTEEADDHKRVEGAIAWLLEQHSHADD